jgi:hypothetical protein
MANLNLFNDQIVIPIRETFLQFDAKKGNYSLIFVDVENNKYILESDFVGGGRPGLHLKKLIEG